MKVSYTDSKFSLLDHALVDDNLYILGSNEVLCNLVDLCAYGWKFFPKATIEPLEYLPLEQKPLDLDTAEIIRKTIFPTLSDSEKDETVHYYGSISSGSQTLYMISIPRGSKSVVFMEGEVVKIEVDMEEPKDETLLWFVISKDGIVSDINLSYYSWLNSTLPHRNYQQHVVGPDYHIDAVEEEGGYWFDKTSGTILANTESAPTPILDSIKRKFENNRTWSPRIHYRKGATAIYTYEWIALEDNIGEVPPYSSSWMRKDVMDTFGQDISIVSCHGGKVVPSIIPTPFDTVIDHLESVELDYGYILSGHLSESYDAYVDKTYTLKDIQDVDCVKSTGVLTVPTEEIQPKIEVYINNGEVSWPKENSHDAGITKDLRVSLGGSFTTDSNFSTPEKIGEITGVTKSYIGDAGQILGTDTKVDSLIIGEAKTPILSDTITLPCRTVRYDITLTYFATQMIVEEHSGFYINLTQQISLDNETKHFYLKPVSSDITTCTVDILLVNNNTKINLQARPGKISDGNIVNSTFGFKIDLTKRDDGIFDLSIANPKVENIKINIYGS